MFADRDMLLSIAFHLHAFYDSDHMIATDDNVDCEVGDGYWDDVFCFEQSECDQSGINDIHRDADGG